MKFKKYMQVQEESPKLEKRAIINRYDLPSAMLAYSLSK